MKSGKHNLFVDYICRTCGKRKAQMVSIIRLRIKRKKMLGYCIQCHPRYTPLRKGGIKMALGYRWLHFSLIEPEILAIFVAEGLDLKRRVRYLQEHRIVAVKLFGRLAASPDIRIRHRDGDKQNNIPSNLLIGTDQDNKDDHMDSIRKMMEWRQTALLLWELLRFQLNQKPLV